jgi:transposase
MLSFNRRTKVYVSREPTDMRASYDTLFAKASGVLNQDPFSGHLFLFMNSKRSSIKCLYYDGTGLVIIAKRLEKGLFSKINPMQRGELVLTPAEFALFFEGADLEKRFIDSPSEIKKRSDKASDNNLKKEVFPMSQELQQSFS